MGPRGWEGGAGYRSGGRELGSSAHTTSCACSRASALSTRRAARRGLPSARLGTCASSPRTRPWTWVKGANVSGQGPLNAKGDSCLQGAHLRSVKIAFRGSVVEAVFSSYPEGRLAGFTGGGGGEDANLFLQSLPPGFQG